MTAARLDLKACVIGEQGDPNELLLLLLNDLNPRYQVQSLDSA